MASTTSMTTRGAPTGAAPFTFLDPGPLIDRELELVLPAEHYFDDLLFACKHPLTLAKDPEWAHTDREDLERLLKHAPHGHEPGDPARGKVPTYHFWMRRRPSVLSWGNPSPKPALPMLGVLSFRVGSTPDIELYFGHIGYTVFPAARGHHYAERACRLLFPLARAHGLPALWITTGPENIPSRRTCERLGGQLIETLDVPPSHPLYARNQRRKCRYRIPL